MKIDEYIKRAQRRSESLSIEYKQWIDPKDPKDISKIIKGVLALYNNDGGYFYIGVDDNGECLPIDKNCDKFTAFNAEYIQQLIIKYSSEIFEIELVEVPIGSGYVFCIKVPNGFVRPAVCKKDLSHEDKNILRKNQIYARTYNTNNTPSSAEIQYKDWESLIQKLMQNREQDIVTFLNRHFKGNRENVSTLANVMTPISMFEEMDNYKASYVEMLSNRSIQIPNFGTFEIVCVLLDDSIEREPDAGLLQRLLSSNPEITGWPLWVDTRGFNDRNCRPIVVENSWIAFINNLDQNTFKGLDYWQINENRKFYLLRVLEEDVQTNLNVFDPILQIWRVLEGLLVIKEFANSYGNNQIDIKVAIRYTKTQGRRIGRIRDSDYGFNPYYGICNTEILTSEILFNSSDGTEKIIEKCQELLKPIFAKFDGLALSLNQYQKVAIEMKKR